MTYLGNNPNILFVDGQYFPGPSKYNVLLSDLDRPDTSRNEKGELIRNRIRQGVTKIELSFIVSGWQAQVMMKCIEPAQVRVKFYDPRQNTYREADMYVGDRSCSMKKYMPDDTASDILWDVSFNLVEY